MNLHGADYYCAECDHMTKHIFHFVRKDGLDVVYADECLGTTPSHTEPEKTTPHSQWEKWVKQLA